MYRKSNLAQYVDIWKILLVFQVSYLKMIYSPRVNDWLRKLSMTVIDRLPFIHALTLLMLLGERASRETYVKALQLYCGVYRLVVTKLA